MGGQRGLDQSWLFTSGELIHVRFTPKADIDRCSAHVGLVPKVAITALFDYIVSQEQKGFAHRQAETFGRFKIYDELELIR